ncbi:MAG: DUF5696 domain-containing protein [Anaerolineae bacterium]|nr:DUF5696 domain-containing protein [Anaerolineae bacterium]
MAKLTSAIRIAALILAILFSVIPSTARSEVEAAAPGQTDIPPSYALVAENDRFQLYVDAETLAFKLLDKRSGYLWHSGIDQLAQGDRLNRAWQAFAKSGVSIEYLDAKAINKRISITNANHTLTVTPIAQGISAQVTFTDFGITLGVNLQLEADGVRVEVPFSSIREENPDFKLGLVHLYPFLGATRGGGTPGYMFLPDGTGTLIRFADATKAKNMFYGRYYGPDLGMIATLPFDPQINRPYPISFPVFGIVHGEGQNAFLAVVEKGAAYGELQAHPAGIITNFNFIYNAFIYNQSYFQATNRSGAGVTTLQRQPNAFDVVVHYRFLAGEAADYVGMARSYQRYLVERGLLNKMPVTAPDIGIRLEFLGGDKEKVLLWQRFVPMTTFRQADAILADLGVANPEVIFYGWQPLGASSMPPTALKLEGDLGSLADLRGLMERVASLGGHFSLYLDPQAALHDEPGYSPRNDLALAITNVNLEGYNRNKVNAYFTAAALQRRYLALARDVAETLGVGLALDGIGWTLYSDFRRERPLNREQAIQAYREILAQSPASLGLYRPNDYLWSLARAYYDMPLSDNGYTYTSEAVPFLPVVLAGHLPCYGIALNFSSDPQEDLLRHVDYGMYPSYFLTHEVTAKMLNTRSNWIYTSSYAQWGQTIRETYAWMNGLLAPVRGQEIIARRKLAEGVVATTYANGKTIVVNYTDRPYAQGGMEVAARNAALWEVVP